MSGERVLIAEDDEGIYELVSSELIEDGWSVSRASTGSEVLSIVRDDPPFLLILDYGLPDMNGQELLEKAINSELSVPPFILSTGRGDEGLAVRMMKLGARDYVVKDSVFLDHLAETVRRVRAEIHNEIMLRQTRAALGASEALFLGFFDQAPIGILVVDSVGRATNANPSFLRMWDADERFDIRTIDILKGEPFVSTGFSAIVSPAFFGTACREYGFSYRLSASVDKNERSLESRIFDVSAFPIFERGELLSVVVIHEDVTARFQAEEKLRHVSLFDPITGLPNRRQVIDRLAEGLSFLKTYEAADAFMLLNLDRFKMVNEARGTNVGDAVLASVGQRLREHLRDVDFVGRVAADEFALVCPTDGAIDERSVMDALSAAERIRGLLAEPFVVEGESHTLTASIGITLFPDTDQDSPMDVYRRADTALHRAKSNGGNQCAFFEREMGMAAVERYRTERELADAIGRNQFALFLQPQVRADGKIVGAEALIRWNHPVRGLLAPGAFISVAEESDLIVRIGEWVLTEACALMAGPFRNRADFTISVNVSPRHFKKKSFDAWVIELFSSMGVRPASVTLEITEGLFLGDSNAIVEKMTRLADAGFVFSIDDFGTGYSSLAYLKRFPLSELKIDKSFVQDAPTDPNDAALVESILAVAGKMSLSVVAEGVESRQQVEFLSTRAEMSYQGYLFGRPVPVSDFPPEGTFCGTDAVAP